MIYNKLEKGVAINLLRPFYHIFFTPHSEDGR